MSPELIRKDRADELISEIHDPAMRNAIRMLVEAVVSFRDADPSRLKEPFDLSFFVAVLQYEIEDISKLMRGVVPAGVWGGNDDPTPEEFVQPRDFHPHQVDESDNIPKPQFRVVQAVNYAFLHEDPWVGDDLFMVMAVDAALRPGQPVRLALER